MKGILYAVGVGPGDPELLTLKAVRVIREANVIACPSKDNTYGVAYNIALRACPEIASKEKLLLDFPMKAGDITSAHKEASERITKFLEKGKSVAFLTLGDPEVYSTFSYFSDMVCEKGFEIEVISGITSFCAAAAGFNIPVSIGSEAVLITAGEYRDFDGTLIIMKAGKKLVQIKEKIREHGKKAWLVENSGMPDEKFYYDIDSIPDTTGYFSLMIVKG